MHKMCMHELITENKWRAEGVLHAHSCAFECMHESFLLLKKCLFSPSVSVAVNLPHLRWPLGRQGAEDLGPPSGAGVLVFVKIDVLVGVAWRWRYLLVGIMSLTSYPCPDGANSVVQGYGSVSSSDLAVFCRCLVFLWIYLDPNFLFMWLQV